MSSFVFAAALLAAGPAFADSADNASIALGQTSEAAAALSESGVKAVVGVSAAPVAITGSVAVGVGDSVATAGSAAIESGADSAAFANAPLSVSDDVVLAPAPQPKPNVPFDAQQPGRQP